MWDDGTFINDINLSMIDDTPIRQYESLIRDIINEFALNFNHSSKSFKTSAKEKFKFETENGWGILTSLLDVIGDTELAKNHFSQFGVDRKNTAQTGEQYLRIYGLLNGIYLQKSAVLHFLELVKYPNKKELINTINKLEILKLRNIAAAHTIDYFDYGLKNSYHIVRITLPSILVMQPNNTLKGYDIKKLIDNCSLTTIFPILTR